MKSYAPVLGFFSLLWLGLGTMWLSNMICGGSDSSVFTVTDGKFMTQSTDIFSFKQSTSAINNYSSDVKASFTKVAKHLEDNPNRMLALTGFYGENETNKTDFEDLGVARAETIKAKLVDLGVVTDRITTTGQQSDNLSFNKKRLMEGGVNFDFSSSDAAPSSDAGSSDIGSTSESDGGTTTFSAGGAPMNLNITSPDFDLSGNTDFQNYIQGLAAYISDNPKKRILISAYNDDSDTRTKIRREMRSYLREELGLSSSNFAKAERTASESPSGEAMVTVGLK